MHNIYRIRNMLICYSQNDRPLVNFFVKVVGIIQWDRTYGPPCILFPLEITEFGFLLYVHSSKFKNSLFSKITVKFYVSQVVQLCRNPVYELFIKCNFCSLKTGLLLLFLFSDMYGRKSAITVDSS